MRALVVDDQPADRKLLRTVLNAEGITVLEADDGVAALRVLETSPVDVVLSDILLPHMDGFRLCHEIRSRPAIAAVPVLLVSGSFLTPDDAGVGAGVGADGFIPKPFSAPVLLALIARVTAPGYTRAPSSASEPVVLKQYADLLREKLTTKARALEETQQVLLQRNAELQEALTRLRDREARLAVLVANVPAVLWTTDRELRLTSISGAAIEAMGLRESAVPGKRVAELAGPPGDEEATERFLRQALDGRPLTGVGNFGSFAVQFHVEPLRNGAGDVVGTVGAAIDVSERKAAEARIAALNAALQQRAAELDAANKELESFAYSVSHDLRAPLRSLDGFSQALREEYAGKLDAQGLDYLDRVRGASQRMSELIDALLGLSRTARAEMASREVDLTAVAESIAADLAKAAPERKVRFAIAGGLRARGDPALVRAVLDNLLRNAWKFTGHHPEAVIEVGATQADGEACFFVRDDGAGFDPAYADKLFRPFQRLHAAGDFEGTGVGLATVHRIVQRHGGRVWAEGQVEKGATFYFTLGEGRP
ncbi:MAG TPA: response regulator [Candidatus Thermoplasmatota archaeon]|jgi:PAS domain S-box-containing protein|nr:response regulator [Candidatus Thermoplasmatota archaeon]